MKKNHNNNKKHLVKKCLSSWLSVELVFTAVVPNPQGNYCGVMRWCEGKCKIYLKTIWTISKYIYAVLLLYDTGGKSVPDDHHVTDKCGCCMDSLKTFSYNFKFIVIKVE